MSLLEFQRALCDMTLDLAFAASVLRKGAPALKGYRLTGIEEDRLIAVVSQRGMSVNCTLARANRFAPIADAFPLTCSLLKPHLRGLLDELWSVHRPGNYQLAGEAGALPSFWKKNYRGANLIASTPPRSSAMNVRPGNSFSPCRVWYPPRRSIQQPSMPRSSDSPTIPASWSPAFNGTSRRLAVYLLAITSSV